MYVALMLRICRFHSCHSNTCSVQTILLTFNNHNYLISPRTDPGYGISGGVASLESINEAGEAVLELVMQSGWEADRIIFFGWSLGTGVASHLAAKLQRASQPPRALLLQSPYASIRALVRHYVGFLFGGIASALSGAGKFWDSEKELRGAAFPIFIIHGIHDNVIPLKSAERLVEKAALTTATFVGLAGRGHNDITVCDVLPHIVEFCATLTPAESKIGQPMFIAS
jgi:pimeloyl-ACP methyl ester carboxylesterase